MIEGRSGVEGWISEQRHGLRERECSARAAKEVFCPSLRLRRGKFR